MDFHHVGFTTILILCGMSVALLPTTEARRRSVWAETSLEKNSDVVQTRITEYGEKETRVSVNGILAMETTEPNRGEDFLFVKEAVKHDRLVWLAYMDKEHIIDCNITTDIDNVDKFKRKFNNGTPTEFKKEFLKRFGLQKKGKNDFLDFRALLKECRDFRRKVKEIRKEHNQEAHQHKIPPTPDSDSLTEDDDENSKDSKPKSRTKRSMFSMMYPGTKWCGKGNRASGGYDDLGENVATDRCCREHDHCPYTISGFSKDYNYFNYKFHTLSHCTCEEKFKSCLKSADNSVANMIGYIYFNYVGTHCFNLKPKKICRKRTWWGKCKRYKTKFSARVLENELTF